MSVTNHRYFAHVNLFDNNASGSTVDERDALSELVSRCPDELIETIVDSLLRSEEIKSPVLLREPQVGTIQLQVREPICRERFILADALVTLAEVSVDGVPGWAMRIGATPTVATAAAVLDAWFASPQGDTALRVRVLEEIRAADRRRSNELNVKRRQILSTTIEFEELD